MVRPRVVRGRRDRLHHEGNVVMEEIERQKCTFKGCENRGEPLDGFDFFACENCLDEFEKELERAWIRHYLPGIEN